MYTGGSDLNGARPRPSSTTDISASDNRTGSLDQRIREDIVANIKSGIWRPGHKIPTERELTEQYGCSRMTVSKAIASLVLAGLIERNKKAGSFVCQPPLETAAFGIPDLAQLIRARGDDYGFALHSRTVLARCEMLEGARGEQLELVGVHLANGAAFATEYRIINLAAAPGAREADFAAIQPGTWLIDHIPWSNARHRISARPAGKDAALLDVEKSTACLSVERWTWHGECPVTYVRSLFPGHLYDLIAEFAPT